MGVYIKGREMPNNCQECVCINDEYFYCQAVGRQPQDENVVSRRPNWCPLVEVPPHGDLIDAFAFRREMDANYPFDKLTQSKHGEADAAKSTILRMLVTAPTIIEAEGET